MTKYEVLIFFDSKNDYYVPKRSDVLPVKIISSVPYDKVSSRFKKYSHKILYKEPYKSYEYDVNIYDERKKFVWDLYPFCYYHPTRQVESVEFYFSFDDTNNENPLVAGFVQKDLTDTVYYRYNFLKGRRTAHGLPSDGLFKAGDLLTVLLQEKYKNQNNILTCPRLKPSAESAKYPSVGTYANKIAVSKTQDLKYEYFDKYEHKFEDTLKISSFYINDDNNCLYINCLNKFKIFFLYSVGFYFPKNSNLNTPLGQVTITELKEINLSNLESTLKKENDKIYPTLSFMIEQKEKYSYRINVSNKVDDNLNGFKKFIHETVTEYKDKSSEVLYNGKTLVVKNKTEKNIIQKLSDLKGTFTSICVFFGTKDDNIPLLIQVINSNTDIKNYIKNNDVNFWEEVEIQVSEENIDLLNKLNEVQASISKSVSILIDTKDNYGLSELQKIPGFSVSGSQPENIEVSENTSLDCIKNKGFECYKHTLSSLSDSDSSSSNNDVVLKFFMKIYKDESINSSKYTELNLFDISGKTKQYISYNKGFDIFNVYFYGQDPRPLMICYNNACYRPSSIDDYFEKWVPVNGIDKFNCEDSNEILLDSLRSILYSLNPVQLNHQIESTASDTTYTTHTFYGTEKTEIKITLSPEDMSCYKKYTHTPSKEYVLGEICHNENKLFSDYNAYKELNGNETKFPDNVFVYYYLYDYNHDYPLIISLVFNSGRGDSDAVTEYYELSDKDNLKWTKISDTSNLNEQSELENKLKRIRYGLGISYDKSPDKLIIKSAENCKEDSVAGAVAGTFSVLGLTGAGVGLAYYKFPEFFISLFRKVLIWTPIPVHY
ncbi:conserved hypothetical protein [Theileria orientalis strain Shintoku]|uniref:Uncharacterized protein n=1 Tax=Theileria orientalis strain Shintoku TaxID=869250 RepID=J4C3L4_THEOR|nr:conserved hypothetical protein [Theileria orientalis strain Shintoku]BAM40646.1 conserved hypothetical protein [Theileria orientalis strain Shintoku]|eukprot:XP_009690947.1 conserved hypothetical protein [Theileria orientalis strain Shintoku]